MTIIKPVYFSSMVWLERRQKNGCALYDRVMHRYIGGLSIYIYIYIYKHCNAIFFDVKLKRHKIIKTPSQNPTESPELREPLNNSIHLDASRWIFKVGFVSILFLSDMFFNSHSGELFLRFIFTRVPNPQTMKAISEPDTKIIFVQKFHNWSKFAH